MVCAFADGASGYPSTGRRLSNNNTAEGTNALFKLTTGADNTAVGFDALFNNTTGNLNTANGIGALLNTTAGGSN